MPKMEEEKRAHPRVKAKVKVDIWKNISGSSIDLSESGLSFNASENISSPAFSLQIYFPDEDLKFKTEARLVWKRDLESGASLYGVEFVNLSNLQKEALREELIKTQISGLLSEIKDRQIRDDVLHFFLNDILDYINKMLKLISSISKEKEYSIELEKELQRLNNEILLKGYCLEEIIENKIAINKIKENFRSLVGTWAYKSSIVKRAYEKIRGYPGDYLMLETIYNNKPVSEGIGLYFDKYFLGNPYAVAVRIRKDRLRGTLLSFLNETKLGKVSILNIACGSCREIKELLPNLKTKASIVFSCLDWDEEALKFSQDALLPITPKDIEFKFIKEDIMNLVKNESSSQSLGKENLIYSIGLIDYLPDRVLKKLIYALYQLLQKDGKLILTHKNKDKTFPPLPPDWFCDWKFVPRNKEEAINLFYSCGISDFSLTCESDDFGYIYFFTLTKR